MATSFPFKAHPSPLHSISHALCVTGGPGSLCASPLWAQTPGVVWRRVPGHVCFPLAPAHGAQEVHKWWISHFQPGPWLSGGTEGPSSFLFCHQQAQAGAASPRPPHQNHKFAVGLSCSPPILGSSSLPGLAASLGVWGCLRTMQELTGIKSSLVQGLRVRASPLCFPLHSHAPWINLLGVDGSGLCEHPPRRISRECPWGTFAWEHPETHQHEGVHTGSILLLFGCFLLFDGHWWDLPLLSSLVCLRTNLLVCGDLMEV